MKTKRLRLEALRADPDNARRHPEANLRALEASLRLYGQRRPVVVRREGLVLEAGHGLVEAARRLGWAEVEALVLDDDEVTARGYALADNRTAELAEWDCARLEELLADLPAEHLIGWDEPEAPGPSSPDDQGVDPDAEWTAASRREAERSTQSLPGAPGAAFGLRDDFRPDVAGAWDLPVLRADRLLPMPPEPPRVATYRQPVPGGLAVVGRGCEVHAQPGPILCYYSPDQRFERAFSRPAEWWGRLLEHRPAGFTGVDFSICSDDPHPVRLWALYRQRWATRYGQEAGLPCWPTLSWAVGLGDAELEPTFAGFPRGAYCGLELQGYGGEAWYAERLRQLRLVADLVEPAGLFLYGDPACCAGFVAGARELVPRVDPVASVAATYREEKRRG